MQSQSKSKSLRGVTDLTLIAPLKRGLVPAADSRSYATRARTVMGTLNTLRLSSLEAEPTPLIADVVDSIRSLHAFRLAIVGPLQDQLLLSVAFDGGWEPYMRRIWRDLGPLLDVIFCNCEGYLLAHDHSFAAYADWVRSAQVNTDFFYQSSALSVSDLHYLARSERERIDGKLDARQPAGDILQQSLPALTALYRLTDLYSPSGADGACLLRAARHLLPEVYARTQDTDKALSYSGLMPIEDAAVRWFAAGAPEHAKPGGQGRDAPSPAKRSSRWDPAKVQSGIVEPYEGASHGCLLLINLADARSAEALLVHLEPYVCSAADQRRGHRVDRCYVNVAFTFRGLEVAGAPRGTLDSMPQEFREGMAARAGILGDTHHNHPTRWPLPPRNGPGESAGRVQMSSVHALVHFVLIGTPSDAWQQLAGNQGHPLTEAVDGFASAIGDRGVRILSVEAMQRFPATNGASRDHFGFVDGISQPNLNANPDGDTVATGDLLLGHVNSFGDPPSLEGRLWDNSTFLVVRKLRQHLDTWKDVLRESGVDADEVKAKMMGRWPDGRNVVDGAAGNRFDFREDRDGAKCPLQSHIRRANPRAPRNEPRLADLVTIPRILRRGMSYGPRYTEGEQPGLERGVVFMAYNASIAEQFEVIQSWLSGGNSSGEQSYSGLRDPILGVARQEDPSTFVYGYEREGKHLERRVHLPHDRPFVTVEWGEYFYVPSMRALDELRTIAREAADAEAQDDDAGRKREENARKARLASQVARGAPLVARLQQLRAALGEDEARTQWKIALEDFGAITSGVSDAIWAAIRELHGGVLSTPYGVLVGGKDRVDEVFQNHRLYTVTGYAERMRESFGEIYLGKDPDGGYASEANGPNAAIMAVDVDDAFAPAFKATQDYLRKQLDSREPRRIEVKDIVGHALAEVSREFFGLPDDRYVIPGWHWRAGDPPACPRHFNSPSRYLFQPNPGPEATQLGQRHGKALKEAVRQFVAGKRKQELGSGAAIARALFAAIDEDERLTSTLIGVMMGFLPTVDGNLRNVLFAWVSDGSLWDRQVDYLADNEADSLGKARRILFAPLRESMQQRPVPPIVWRTAREAHSLGTVMVRPGDRIAVSIVSATQESLLEGDNDVFTLFGGNRRAQGHPTHACPGYKMAFGVMLGVLASILATTEFRPTLTPLALKMWLRA